MKQKMIQYKLTKTCIGLNVSSISFSKLLHRQIKAKNWNEVNESISSLSTVIGDNSTRSSIKIDLSGKSILHHVCCMRPPLETVEKIVDVYPGLVHKVDFSKRLPLHYAIEMGASPQVVNYLLSIDKDTVLHRDSKGRTPLHLAFNGNSEYWCDTGNEAGDIIEGPLYEVVEALCLAAPSAIVLEDNCGMSALERAINIEMRYNFIKLMQKLSVSSLRRRQREMEITSYDFDHSIKKCVNKKLKSQMSRQFSERTSVKSTDTIDKLVNSGSRRRRLRRVSPPSSTAA